MKVIPVWKSQSCRQRGLKLVSLSDDWTINLQFAMASLYHLCVQLVMYSWQCTARSTRLYWCQMERREATAGSTRSEGELHSLTALTAGPATRPPHQGRERPEIGFSGSGSWPCLVRGRDLPTQPTQPPWHALSAGSTSSHLRKKCS